MLSRLGKNFLLKRFTNSSSSFFDSSAEKIKLPMQVHFLLCQTCFWCASCTDINTHIIAKCPSLNSVKLESMPIFDNEVYRFDYHPKRGVILEFSRNVDRKGIKI